MRGKGAVRILCVGIAPCIQRTLQCGAFRPGEVNRVRSVTVSTGGKAVNVARALKRLGSDPVVTGFAGGETGCHLVSLLEGMGIENDFVYTDPPTRICTTVVDESAGSVTEIVEEAAVPAGRELEALNRKVALLLPRCPIALIAGALPPGTPEDTYARLAETVMKIGRRLMVDAQQKPLLETLPLRPLLVKMNREELERTCGCAVNGEEALFAASRGLLEDGARWVLVTNGAGAAYLLGDGKAWRFHPASIRQVNSVGCGDAATAGIAHGLAGGGAMPEAVRLGMACGAANATTLTPGDVDPETVRRLAEEVRVQRIP